MRCSAKGGQDHRAVAEVREDIPRGEAHRVALILRAHQASRHGLQFALDNTRVTAIWASDFRNSSTMIAFARSRLNARPGTDQWEGDGPKASLLGELQGVVNGTRIDRSDALQSRLMPATRMIAVNGSLPAEVKTVPPSGIGPILPSSSIRHERREQEHGAGGMAPPQLPYPYSGAGPSSWARWRSPRSRRRRHDGAGCDPPTEVRPAGPGRRPRGRPYFQNLAVAGATNLLLVTSRCSGGGSASFGRPAETRDVSHGCPRGRLRP